MNKLSNTLACVFAVVLQLHLNFPLEANNGGESQQLENAATSPFELARGMIIVQAMINGEQGNFILDTGSPMMILNGNAQKNMGGTVKTIGGQLKTDTEIIDEFSWAGVERFGMEAIVVDIGHLEKLASKPLKGLIGYEFFGSLDLFIDFESRQLKLLPFGYAAEGEERPYPHKIPFTMEGHLAVVEAEIAGAKYRFGLDTGAGINLLNIQRKGEIALEQMVDVGETNVVGLGGNSSSFQTADILETYIAGQNFEKMRFIFTDISGLPNLADHQVDGLLGFPFFKTGKFSINYHQRIIHFWQ